MSEVFIIGTKEKYRFKSSNGLLRIEELWSLSLEALDTIALELDAQIEKAPTKSFIKKNVDAGKKELSNKLEIVKYIITDKLNEAERKETLREKRKRREELVRRIEAKRNEADAEKPLADLEKELFDLDNEE